MNRPENMAERESQMPILLSIVVDRPNIVTLLGLGSGILAIYFLSLRNFRQP